MPQGICDGVSRREEEMMEGFRILNHGGLVRRIGASEFEVRAPGGKAWFKVDWQGKTWRCECRKGRRYVSTCVHAAAVMLLLRLPSVLTVNLNPDQFACPRCSARLDEADLSGVQRNKSGMVQRYECRKCGYRYNDRANFERLKTNPTLVVVSTDLYLRGLSIREVSAHLKMIFDCDVSHTTVYRWAVSLCRVLREVEKAILPKLKLGRRWHGDEMITKVDGSLQYLWNILDSRSRYLLASSLRARRDTATFKKVLSEVIAQVGSPRQFVSDYLGSYKEGLPQVDPSIRHLGGRKYHDKGRGNLVERANKSLRRRIKMAEQYSNPQKADILLNGSRVHYNLVRPHEALQNRTPGEKAGYRFRSTNKLLELIKLNPEKKQSHSSLLPR